MKDNSSLRLAQYFMAFVVVVVVFMIGIFIGQLDVSFGKVVADDPSYDVVGDLKSEYNNVDINLLWETWATLEEEYIESDINGQELLYGATKGLVAGLGDPYTVFLTPEETLAYFSSNKGEFEGIGATLKQEGEYVAIESPLEGSPASKEGLKPGDVILKVEGASMHGLSVYEVAATIRGEAGTKVSIELIRPDTEETYIASITRATIDLDNIVVEKIDDEIMMIKIYKFTEDDVSVFNAQWDKAVVEVLAENPKGLVIDLRNNPGGYVSAVEYVLGEFLKKGDVIFAEEDKKGHRVEYKVSRKGSFTSVPLAILVNGGSASASEIMAGALQDHGRALIIGESTVGKGVEQKLITLSDGSMLQVVFQKWLTPSGRNINKDNPIIPDVEEGDYDAQEQLGLEYLRSNF